jgi:hypothetical protein
MESSLDIQWQVTSDRRQAAPGIRGEIQRSNAGGMIRPLTDQSIQRTHPSTFTQFRSRALFKTASQTVCVSSASRKEGRQVSFLLNADRKSANW